MATRPVTLMTIGLTLLAAAGAGAQDRPPAYAGGHTGYAGSPAYGTPRRLVVPVQQQPSRASVKLGGTVVPYKEVTLSAQVPGRVKYLAGKEGDSFKKGTILAELDDKELRARQAAAWAAIRDADASIRNANIQYNRELIAPQQSSPSSMPGMGLPSLFDQFFTRPMGDMMGYGDPSVERYSNLYQRGYQMEQARNARLRAQSELSQIESKLRDTKSVAPFDGVIVKKLVEVGDTMQPGQPLLQFADTQYLQIQVDVPARLMPGLNKGMLVSAILDVHNAPVNVRVAQIFPMADPQRHTVTVKLDIPTGAPAAPGMYAEVLIPDANAPVTNVVVIPTAAVIQRGSLPMVEVAKGQEKKELRVVRLGEYVDADHVTVLSGLNAGDFVYLQADKIPPSGNRPVAPPQRRGKY